MKELECEIEQYLKLNKIEFTQDSRHSHIFKLTLSNNSIFYLYADRWQNKKDLVISTIKSRRGDQESIFARKCKIITASGSNIQKFKDFLELNHFYGNSKAKYYLALEYCGKIVAVASFSASRQMPRYKNNPTYQIPVEQNPHFNPQYSSKEIVFVDSYEWVRYASTVGTRVVGGMGRLLKEFERTICKKEKEITGKLYEIMSYADLEFSNGEVYEQLGFKKVDFREPVEFAILKNDTQRIPLKRLNKAQKMEGNILYTFHNMGSLKYLKPFSI